MSYKFFECSSLTSLNLFNFNTINVKEISHIFDGLNKNCKIETNDKDLLDQIKKLWLNSNYIFFYWFIQILKI